MNKIVERMRVGNGKQPIILEWPNQVEIVVFRRYLATSTHTRTVSAHEQKAHDIIINGVTMVCGPSL